MTERPALRRLERFEALHGDYGTLLNRHVDGDNDATILLRQIEALTYGAACEATIFRAALPPHGCEE